MARKMIIKGVGSFLAKRYNPKTNGTEVVSLGTLQDLKIDMNVELEDIFGGDGLFAIDTLVKSKSIEISATDAKFDLDQLQLMMGSTSKEGVESYIWVMGEQGTLIADTLTASSTTPVNIAEYMIDYPTTVFGDGNFSVRLKDSNTLLVKVALSTTTAPLVGEFMVDPATGRVVLNSAHVGLDIVVNYQRSEKVDLVDILVDEVPFPVHVVHHGSFLQKDGTYSGIETELYMARAKGSFSIDAQRASASSSAIQLQVLDPERADGKLGSIKRFNSNKKA